MLFSDGNKMTLFRRRNFLQYRFVRLHGRNVDDAEAYPSYMTLWAESPDSIRNVRQVIIAMNWTFATYRWQ